MFFLQYIKNILACFLMQLGHNSVSVILTFLHVAAHKNRFRGLPVAAHVHNNIIIIYSTVSQDLDSQFKVREFLTTASPLQLHLLHVNLTGRHPDGNWVNDGRVLWKRDTERVKPTGRR